jgi:hypothetical protein
MARIARHEEWQLNITRDISTDALESFSIATIDGDSGVDVYAIKLD